MEITANNKNNKITNTALLPSAEIKKKPVYSFFKRVFDFLFALIALIILSPIFIIISILIKADDPKGPVIYVSQRLGKDGVPFKFYKFRSMCTNADKIYNELKAENETAGPTFKMKNDPRVTRVGKFIRKTSIDELPQLFNILKGDMSFIGPRPPMIREVESYPDYPMERLAVVGGLSCYWQVMGRSSIDFDGMIELDLKYIKERGFITDIKILLLTIPAVFKGEGAY